MALLPHSMKVAGSIPGISPFLCEVSMFSLCLRGFSPLPASKAGETNGELEIVCRCYRECGRLFVFHCSPVTKLATCPECNPVFVQS